MKTIFVGDTHLMSRLILPNIHRLVALLGIGRVIFLGDYLDQFNCDWKSDLYFKELETLSEFKATMEERGVEVIFLIGNHELPYLLDKPSYYSLKTPEFRELKSMLIKLGIQVGFRLDDFIVSHGGYVGSFKVEEWHLKSLQENDLELLIPLQQAGFSRGGKGYGSPLWADYEREVKVHFQPTYPKQVVGHTPSTAIKMNKSEEMICCDTLSLDRNLKPIGDGSLLLYEDVKLTVIKNPNWQTIENQERIKNYLEV
jgi:predicted phosphodiesterase